MDKLVYSAPQLPENSDEAIDDAVLKDMRGLVQKKFAAGLLPLVDELAIVYSHEKHGKHQESPAGVAEAPHLVGHSISHTSPALEFVKATTFVLGLDNTLEDEVIALRRMLLAQLRVKEFSPEASFQDMGVSYVLSDVVCSFCSSCRDYDLLGDPLLTDGKKDRLERWRCPHCGTQINLDQVENRLMEEVDRLCNAYCLQDFRCPKTHSVSTRLCSSTSGMYIFKSFLLTL